MTPIFLATLSKGRYAENTPLQDCNYCIFYTSVRAGTYALRHKYMSHGECFIHDDLHASNLFGNEEHLKIIDMEYTFAHPYCYDIYYFSNSLLGEYVASCFRDFPWNYIAAAPFTKRWLGCATKTVLPPRIWHPCSNTPSLPA